MASELESTYFCCDPVGVVGRLVDRDLDTVKDPEPHPRMVCSLTVSAPDYIEGNKRMFEVTIGDGFYRSKLSEK